MAKSMQYKVKITPEMRVQLAYAEALTIDLPVRDILEEYSKEWVGITYDLGDGEVMEVANEIRKDATEYQ